MMKKVLALLFVCSFLIIHTEAQVNTDADKSNVPLTPKKKKQKPKRQDFIILDFNWNTWLNKPAGTGVSPFSRGFNFYLMYDLPLGRSPLSFATGLGISTENIYLTSFLQQDSAGGLFFQDIEGVINADNPSNKRDWNRYKLATTILELPIEFRYRANPDKRNTFKLHVGFKIGYVITSWEKYVGPDYRNGVADLDNTVKIKEYKLPGVNRFRYGIYARIGWSRYFATFSYSFSNFFENGKGADGVVPFTAGLSISIF